MLALLDPVNPWLAVFGRTHPLILHLPIGLFVGIAVLEFGAMMFRRQVPRGAIATLTLLAAVTAAMSAASGWVLGGESEYGGVLLDRHKALGIATAVCALLCAPFAGLKARAAFRWLLVVTLGVMTAAGHLGASITHTEDFLFAPLEHQAPVAKPEAAPPAPAPGPGQPLATTPATGPANPTVEPAPKVETPAAPPTAPSYGSVIAPFLERTCTKCHNATKHKGDLQLHTAAGIMAGGEKEVALVPGKLDESRMYVRLTLPLDDDDHMPPEDKPQPTAEEIEALRQWILAGAPFGDAPGTPGAGGPPVVPPVAPPPPAPVVPQHNQQTPAPAEPTKKQETGAAPPAAVQALQQSLAHVAPIAQGSPLLQVDFAAIAPQVDDARAAALLQPLGADIAELSLARTTITDAALPPLATMPNLRKLDLRSTAVTSAGVAALQRAPQLERLVLAETHLDDAAIASLQAMPQLREVYLWQSGVSAEAVAKLRTAAPQLTVDDGEAVEEAVLETEPEVVLAKVAAAPLDPALQPINDCCPVSGKPVDLRFLVVHDGKVIGFCCPDCPQTFWQEPAKYPVAAK